MKRTASSTRWMNEHFNDHYVKRAQQEGYRSRAAYKLLELQEKDNLLRPGMTIVDLGAAPGGWSIVAQRILQGNGKIIALDLLEMSPIPGVEFIQGDFSQEQTFEQLKALIDNCPIDLVMSDIAPNISGITGVDQARSMYLAELALDFATQVLKEKGSFLVKVFQGEGFDNFLQSMRQLFTQVKIRKPKASRSRSNELYLLGIKFKKDHSSQKG